MAQLQLGKIDGNGRPPQVGGPDMTLDTDVEGSQDQPGLLVSPSHGGTGEHPALESGGIGTTETGKGSRERGGAAMGPERSAEAKRPGTDNGSPGSSDRGGEPRPIAGLDGWALETRGSRNGSRRTLRTVVAAAVIAVVVAGTVIGYLVANNGGNTHPTSATTTLPATSATAATAPVPTTQAPGTDPAAVQPIVQSLVTRLNVVSTALVANPSAATGTDSLTVERRSRNLSRGCCRFV
jgi:hypothetical protein